MKRARKEGERKREKGKRGKGKGERRNVHGFSLPPLYPAFEKVFIVRVAQRPEGDLRRREPPTVRTNEDRHQTVRRVEVVEDAKHLLRRRREFGVPRRT